MIREIVESWSPEYLAVIAALFRIVEKDNPPDDGEGMFSYNQRILDKVIEMLK